MAAIQEITDRPKLQKFKNDKFAKIYWADNPPKGLEQIGDRIPEIKNSIRALNSILYSDKQSKNLMPVN